MHAAEPVLKFHGILGRRRGGEKGRGKGKREKRKWRAQWRSVQPWLLAWWANMAWPNPSLVLEHRDFVSEPSKKKKKRKKGEGGEKKRKRGTMALAQPYLRWSMH